ncbi:MAG: hypothetical protein C4540_04635 [Candidatus Omnitrophota bacterium]|jgi:hypothetical protein|nr:MAG: hypothetical protein C4540_04635 [Candidatus Omnitrophota bacterium]
MDSEERQKKLAERSKRLRERELNDISKVLKTPEGRRLLWRILTEAETFIAPATEKQIVGMRLFNDIMLVAPEMFLQMQREYRSEQESLKKEFPPDPDEL